jgi:hypothetical protein
MFGTFAFPMFVIGLSMIIMPALAGKAAVFRFFFGSQTWTMFSAMSVGLYYTTPMIAIFYFMSTQHQINITYYMFVYYFTGNMIFGLVVVIFVVAAIDRPIHALINLKGDVEEAERSTDYKLEQYL